MKFSLVGGLSIVIALLASCGSAQFSGSGGGSRSDTNQTTSTNPTNIPTESTPPGNVPSTVPSTGTVTTTGPNGPGIPGTVGVPSVTEYQPVPGTPGYNGSVPADCNGKPCGETKVPEFGNSTAVQQPNANTVTFSRNSVIRIGNGEMSGSSCRLVVSLLPLKGSVYFFQFEVTADNTAVNINIGRACGIDYSSGTVQLASGKAIVSQPLAAGSSSVSLPSQTLNRGMYTLYVYAGKGDDVRGPKWDIDDFLVGNVSINANQAIKPGQFGAYDIQ